MFYVALPRLQFTFSFSFCVQNTAVIFNNYSIITASFVPYSPNLVGKHKPGFWQPRPGGPQGKYSSIFYKSRTSSVFQNIYSSFSKNSPMSNTQSSFFGKNKGKHITVFILILFIFHTESVSTAVGSEYRFSAGYHYY